MKLIEILDSAGIDSLNIQNWIEECVNFRFWYCKTGTQKINDLDMEKAYLKIMSIEKHINSSA